MISPNTFTKIGRYNGFIIQHIDNKTLFEERENIVDKPFNLFLKKLTCIAYVYRWIYVTWTYVHREFFLPYVPGSVSMC